MQQGNVLVIGVGSSANDGTGDPLRTAFQKINSNFAGIYDGGQFLANVSSISTRPSYSWTGNVGTGLYLKSPNTIGIAGNLELLSSANYYKGNIFLGSSSIDQIYSPGSNYIYINSNSRQGNVFIDSFNTYISDNAYLRGNVIQDNSSAKLYTYGNVYHYANVFINGDGALNPTLYFDGFGNTAIYGKSSTKELTIGTYQSAGIINLYANNIATTGNINMPKDRSINLNVEATHRLFASGGDLYFQNSTTTFNISQAASGAGVVSINGKTGIVTLYTDNVVSTTGNVFVTTGTQTYSGIKYFEDSVVLDGQGDSPGGSKLYLTTNSLNQISANSSPTAPDANVIYIDANGSKGQIQLNAANTATTGNVLISNNRFINLNTSAVHHLYATGGALFFKNSTDTFNITQAISGAGVTSINGKTGTVTLYTDNVVSTTGNVFVTTGTQTYSGIKYFEDSLVLDGQGDAPGGSKLYLTTNAANQISANSSPTSPDGNVIYIDANGSKGQIQLNAANTATTGNILITDNRRINLNTSSVHNLFASGGRLYFQNTTNTLDITGLGGGGGGGSGTITKVSDVTSGEVSNARLAAGIASTNISNLTVSGNVISGNVLVTGQIRTGTTIIGESIYANSTIALNKSGGATINFVDDLGDTSDTSIGYSNSGDSLVFTVNGNTILSLTQTASSNAAIVAGPLVPSGNNIYDLGGADNRWKDLYLSGSTIYLGGAQISSPSAGIINLPAGSTINGSAIGTSAGAVSLTGGSGITASPTTITSTGSFSVDASVVRTSNTSYVLTSGTQTIGGIKYFDDSIVLDGQGDSPGGSKLYLTTNALNQISANSSPTAPDANVIYIDANASKGQIQLNAANTATTGNVLISNNRFVNLNTSSTHRLFASGGRLYFQNTTNTLDITGLQGGGGGTGDITSVTAGDGLSGGASTGDATLQVDTSVVRTSNTSYVLTTGSQTITGSKNFTGGIYATGVNINNNGTGATLNFIDDLNTTTDTSIYYQNSADAIVVAVNGTNMLEMVSNVAGKSIATGAGVSPTNDNTEYLGIPTNRWKYFYLSDTAYIGGASVASANINYWNSAYTDRLKWDGGSTGLTASTGRTSLGATGVGSNLFTLTNPSAVTFLRVNADNSVSALDASTFRSAIGAGTSSTNTTYGISAETAASGANLRLTGSDASTDNVNFVGSGAVTVTRTDANTITIDASSGGGGDITSVTAGTGLTGGGASGDVTLSADTSYLVNIGTNQTITAAKTFTSPIVSQGGMWINGAANTTYPTGTLGDVGDNVSLTVKTPGTTSYKALTLSGGTGVLAVPGNIYFTDVKITFGGPSKDLIGRSDGLYYDGTKLGDVRTTGTQTIYGEKTFEDGLVTDGVTIRYGNQLFLPPSSGTVSNSNRIYNDGTFLRFVSNAIEKTAIWDTAYGWGNHASAGYGYSNFDGNYNSLSNLPNLTTTARNALSFVAGSGNYASATGVITIPTNTNQLTNGAGFVTSSGVTSITAGSGLSGGTITGTGTISLSGSYTGTWAVTGAITATGEITAFYSDRRLKENVNVISNSIEKIKQLNGITYNPNDLATTFGYDKSTNLVGLFADEVESVLPEAVKPAPFDIDEKGNSISGENYKTIQYEKLVPLLVEAIKDQQKQIEELKALVDRLVK